MCNYVLIVDDGLWIVRLPPPLRADPLHCTDAARPLVAGVGPSYARPG